MGLWESIAVTSKSVAASFLLRIFTVAAYFFFTVLMAGFHFEDSLPRKLG